MSYEVLMAVVEWDAFKCRPGCTEECTPDDCVAHRRAVQQFETVVRFLLKAEESVRKLQQENKVLRETEQSVRELQEENKQLKEAQKNWRTERDELIKRIEIPRELPGPSRSPTSPAKKRRAHSPEREVSRKRQRPDLPSVSLYSHPAPDTGRFHFHITPKHRTCTTQASPLRQRLDLPNVSLYHRPATPGRFHFHITPKHRTCSTQASPPRQRVDHQTASLHRRDPEPAPFVDLDSASSADLDSAPSAPCSFCCLPFLPAAPLYHCFQLLLLPLLLKPAPARRPGRPRDLILSRELFEEVVEELLRDYHGAVLSSHVPLQSSLLMEEYLHSLWATARLVTKRDRRAAAAAVAGLEPHLPAWPF
ncbi:hypothetical protein CDAR_56521 [Caerostris darwini]|uniref:Uncharacterized protein n=1 Tax=Caerostris darwini TaxID=1538125 RepID=A0AAV4QDF7_9ARAC|nr:hypothetical protein CDAR_56521 [Caerostris darwini]